MFFAYKARNAVRHAARNVHPARPAHRTYTDGTSDEVPSPIYVMVGWAAFAGGMTTLGTVDGFLYGLSNNKNVVDSTMTGASDGFEIGMLPARITATIVKKIAEEVGEKCGYPKQKP
jgi:hypothetical protein